MSSLSATQADGYYLPPEYYDSGLAKKGVTKNQFAKSKGHNQFVRDGIVRFELPYKGICQSCKISIGRGTRYNAKKIDSGLKYFTTTIWEFSMKCHNCSCQWRIRTNPKQRGFDYCDGIKIQEGQQSIVENVGSEDILFLDDKSSAALDRLANQAHDQRSQLTEHDRLVKLQKLNDETKSSDADSNALIRNKFRKDRKAKRSRLGDAQKLGWKDGMELLDSKANLNEQLLSKEVVYGQPRQAERKKLSNVRKSSIFSSSPPTTSNSRRRRRGSSSHQNDELPIPDETNVSSSNSIPMVVASVAADANLTLQAPIPDGITSNGTSVDNDGTTNTDLIARESGSTSTTKPKKRRISSAVLSSSKPIATSVMLPSKSIESNKTSTSISTTNNNSLGNLLAGYGSDSSEE